MTANFVNSVNFCLTLNSCKTESLLIGFTNQLAKIHNCSLDTSHSVRNLYRPLPTWLPQFSLSTINSLSLNYLVSSRSRTFLLVQWLKLPSPVISLPSYPLSTGSGSLNASNTSSFHLPAKFSQLPNLLHGLLPEPLILSYSVFVLSLIFRFCAVRQIKLAISSAFERTLIYRIVS